MRQVVRDILMHCDTCDGEREFTMTEEEFLCAIDDGGIPCSITILCIGGRMLPRNNRRRR